MPTRTCIVCRTKAEQSRFLRVRAKGHEGRSAYFCTAACSSKPVSIQLLERSLRHKFDAEQGANIIKEIQCKQKLWQTNTQ